MPARHALPLTLLRSSRPPQLSSRPQLALLTPLAATLMDSPASVANKRLTAGLSPLAATLTKNTGGLLKDRTPYLSSLSRSRLGREVCFPPVTSRESPVCPERERGGTCC